MTVRLIEGSFPDCVAGNRDPALHAVSATRAEEHCDNRYLQITLKTQKTLCINRLKTEDIKTGKAAHQMRRMHLCNALIEIRKI